jgi:hypothetical protein
LCKSLVEQSAVSSRFGQGDAIPERKLAIGPSDGHAGKVAHIAWTVIYYKSPPGIGKLIHGLNRFR